MEKMIHWSKIWELMERTDSQGSPLQFQVKFVKLSTGEVREYKNCTLSSIHSKGSTLNLLPEGESRPRTIRKVLIIEFNKHHVYL